MKKLFLIVMFGFSILNLNAQDIPSNSVTVSILPSYNLLNYHKDDVRSKGNFNMGFGLTFRRKFSENWQFAAGINYRKYHGKINYNGLIDSVHLIEPAEGHHYFLYQVFNSSEKQTAAYLEPNIRLEYLYPLSSTIDFIGGIGFVYGISIAESNQITNGSYRRYAWFYDDHNLIDDLPSMNLSTYSDFLNPLSGKTFRHSLFALGEVGLKFKLSSKWELLTMLNVQHSLQNVQAKQKDIFTHHQSYSGIAASEIPRGVRAISAGLEIGVVYRFENRTDNNLITAKPTEKPVSVASPEKSKPEAVPVKPKTEHDTVLTASQEPKSESATNIENTETPCYTIAEMKALIREKENIIGKKICAIKQINFDFNKSILRRSDKEYLSEIVDLMKQNRRIKIKINGHTDNVGTPQFNMTLSRNRARAVYNYLIQTGGISAKRLSYEYFGLTRPITDNDTEEGKAINRRVEFEIVEQ